MRARQAFGASLLPSMLSCQHELGFMSKIQLWCLYVIHAEDHLHFSHPRLGSKLWPFSTGYCVRGRFDNRCHILHFISIQNGSNIIGNLSCAWSTDGWDVYLHSWYISFGNALLRRYMLFRIRGMGNHRPSSGIDNSILDIEHRNEVHDTYTCRRFCKCAPYHS